MEEIRAFVGHSFTEDDADVVRSFLSYFTEVSNIQATFSWEHAEEAEPSQLRDKILALLKDKNTFIGICTKKEQVVSATSLKPLWWNATRLSVQTSKIEWKTSDWIIQEIGLSAGRGMSIILFVEEGVRKPGGIQGDIEYITFDRLVPERAHGKFLQMLRALSPTTLTKQLSPSVTGRDTKTIETEDRSALLGDDETISEHWDRADYELAAFRAISKGDDSRIDQISASYLKSKDFKASWEIADWNAYLQSAKILLGKGGDLLKLEQIADENPNNSEVLFYLGSSYQRFSDLPKAADSFVRASSSAKSPELRAKYLYFAAKAFRSAGASAEANTQIAHLRLLSAEVASTEHRLLDALFDLAKDAENKELEVAILERRIQLRPNDTETRFSLAYSHSELGNTDIALTQYLLLDPTERSESAWNNLGVAYDSLNMPTRSVQSYRKSEEQGGTMAMSNLAQKLITAGFLDEAQALCDKALAIGDYDKNIGLLAARLKELPDEETTTLRELRKQMKPKSEFYREIGEAVSAPEPNLGKIWKGPECNLLLKKNTHNNSVYFSGSFKQQQSPLSLAIMGSSISPIERTHNVEVNGTINGRLIQGSLKRSIVGAPPPSILSISNETSTVLMVVSKDLQTIRVMENPNAVKPLFFDLTQQKTEERL